MMQLKSRTKSEMIKEANTKKENRSEVKNQDIDRAF